MLWINGCAKIPVVAERGLVTDRNGVVLAENNTSYTVFARSNAVKDKTGTARLLSDCLGVDGDTLLKKLESVKASEITVARHVGKGAIETLAEANPEGVYYSRGQYARLSQGRFALSGARLYFNRQFGYHRDRKILR